MDDGTWEVLDRAPIIGDLALVTGQVVRVIDGPRMLDGRFDTDPIDPGQPYWIVSDLLTRTRARVHQDRLEVIRQRGVPAAAATYDDDLERRLEAGQIDVFELRRRVAQWVMIRYGGEPWGVQASADADHSDLLLRMLSGLPPLPTEEYERKQAQRLSEVEGKAGGHVNLYGTVYQYPDHPLLKDPPHDRDD
jgi:hypothetical protein